MLLLWNVIRVKSMVDVTVVNRSAVANWSELWTVIDWHSLGSMMKH